MPRLSVPGFVGPSNTLRSIQADADRTINFFLESTAPGTANAKAWLQPTPGFAPVATFPDQPIRGLFEINDRAFVVGGSTFAELYQDYTIGPTFPVLDDGLPVSMASNGSAGGQVLVISGELGYIYGLGSLVLTQITDPDFPNPAGQCDFMDGYFLVNWGGRTRQFSWSSLEDGTTWDPLDTAERSEAADSIITLIRHKREIWLLGFRTSEVWWDSGNAQEIFAPLQGVFLEMGAVSPFSVKRVGDVLIWLSQNVDGDSELCVASGYEPQKIGHFAVPFQIQTQAYPTDAIAFTFQMNGHTFYALTLPRSDRTWLYDLTMNVWTEWNTWNDTLCVWEPKVIGTHMFVWGKHLVGDRFSGGIYELSMSRYDSQIVSPT